MKLWGQSENAVNGFRSLDSNRQTEALPENHTNNLDSMESMDFWLQWRLHKGTDT